LRDFDNVNSSHWLGNDYNNELIAFLLIFYLIRAIFSAPVLSLALDVLRHELLNEHTAVGFDKPAG